MAKLNKFQERTLEHALMYATERGWHVLPVGKTSKRPIIKKWSECATTDELQIVKWWMEFPSANIGILTGPESGFFVVDVDVRPDKNGLEVLQNYFGEKFVFQSKKYLAGRTPTGGVHLLFKWDDDYPVKTTSGILPGVDTRGIGGQIIVAPSARNIDGEWLEYRWNNYSNDICPMQPWTYDLIDLVGTKEDHKVDLSALVTGISEGQRDEQLNKFAWLLKGKGISYELAVGFVMAAAEKCIPPFDPEEAKEKVTRAYLSSNTEDKLDDLKNQFKKS